MNKRYRTFKFLTKILLILLVISPGLMVEAGSNWRQIGDTSFTWHYEIPDGKAFTDLGSRSLDLDNAGRPHIAYGKSHLYYAWYDGSAWRLEIVDKSTLVGYDTSLAIDTSGHPHISYYDDFNEDLKYAYYDGATWHITTVDSSGDVGIYSSLALDGNNRAHISYCLWDTSTNTTCDDLKYAFYDGSNWQIHIVDIHGGYFNSLVLDPYDCPHLAYFNSLMGELQYAWGEKPQKTYLPIILR